MTNILELLKNEKVEWKKLGEVCEIKTGRNINKQIIENNKGSYPVINSGREPLGFYNQYNTDNDPIGITSRGAGVGSITYQEGKYFRGNLNYSTTIKDKSYLNIKFLYHILLEHQESIKKLATFQGIPALNGSELKKLEIPIPSLETQEKIVKILDKFTNYVKELHSELQSRTKQYTYYRDKLLSEEYLTKVTKEMEVDRRLNIVQLEEVVTIKNGKDWKKLGQGNIPVYGSGGEMGVFVDKYSYDKPTVLIPRKGTIDNVFYLDKPFWNVDTIFHTEIDQSKLIPKYFYYFIEHYDLNKLSDNSTRPSLTQSTLNKLKLPLPPLSLQNKIVKVLDKLQVLLADTKGLLPEEIEQRHKQYEYYREKLLTFDEVSDRFDSIRFDS